MKTMGVDTFIEMAEEHGAFAFDVEHLDTIQFNADGFKLIGCGFATEGAEFFADTDADIERICKALFYNHNIHAVAHNAKYDIKCLRAAKLITRYPVSLRCTMVAANLLDDNKHPNQLGLKPLVYDTFGHRMMTYKEAIEHGPRSKEFYEYGLDDVRWTLKLWHKYHPELEKQNLWNLFSKIVMPALNAFSDMEIVGVGWDLSGARGLLTGFQKLRDDMEDAVLSEIGDLNLGSGDQLAKRLFDELGYSTRGIPMTDSGKRLSVDAKAMDTLAKRYPVCHKIKTFRTASKMISTYIEPLTRMCLEDPKRRVHPTFWVVSSTGRTRCTNPNFQNIPAYLAKEFKHLNIRRNVIPADGRRFIVADLSQIELRLCAHFTQDAAFMRAYRGWQCTACGAAGDSTVILHTCPECGADENEKILNTCPKCGAKHVHVDKKAGTCAVCRGDSSYDLAKIRAFWHGLDIHTETTESIAALHGDRQNGKRANFALIYNATARKMHDEYPDLSVDEWQDVITQFFEHYRGVQRWHMQMQRQLYDTGVCTDIFGRRRRITANELRKSPKHALNQFVNFPIQASACNLIMLAIVKLRELFIDKGWWERRVWLTNFVHDEIILEVPDKDSVIADVIDDVQAVTEHVVQLRVPLRMDFDIADNWGIKG